MSNKNDQIKILTGALALAATTTAAGIAYFLNEEKVNKAVDKAADKTNAFVEKVSKRIKEMTDDIMELIEEDPVSEDIVQEDSQVSEEKSESEIVNEEESENPEP